MNIYLKTVGVFLATFSIVWLLVAFVYLDANIFKYNNIGRGAILALSLVCAFIYLTIKTGSE
jgi:hypothetical protein